MDAASPVSQPDADKPAPMQTRPAEDDARTMPLGRATYAAAQSKGTVTIVATGENPTPNWRNAFAISMLRIYPPQFTFHSLRPTGMQAQVMTPFRVSTEFKANEPVARVKVTDADGDHWIDVAQSETP